MTYEPERKGDSERMTIFFFKIGEGGGDRGVAGEER